MVGLAGTLVPSVLMDGTLELLADAPRPVKTRDRVRFHAGTSEVMARVLLLDRPELAPGQSAFARFRLEAPLVAMPDDRFVIRSYSPMVTIGGGTLLDIAPPRFKRKGPALIAHLTLLREGRPEAVVEEHVRHAGVGGVRLAALSGRVPFGPERLRALLDSLQASGQVAAIDRDWFLHPESLERLRGLVTDHARAVPSRRPAAARHVARGAARARGRGGRAGLRPSAGRARGRGCASRPSGTRSGWRRTRCG